MVALLTVAWALFTNHCALGLMRPTLEAANHLAECCGGKKNPSHDTPESPRTCCKIKVTTPASKAGGGFDASKVEFQDFGVIQVPGVKPTESQRTLLVFDHGPPSSLSFAELVLQRSLFSHAPPLV